MSIGNVEYREYRLALSGKIENICASEMGFIVGEKVATKLSRFRINSEAKSERRISLGVSQWDWGFRIWDWGLANGIGLGLSMCLGTAVRQWVKCWCCFDCCGRQAKLRCQFAGNAIATRFLPACVCEETRVCVWLYIL